MSLEIKNEEIDSAFSFPYLSSTLGFSYILITLFMS